MRLLRITTVPVSLRILLKGQLEFMSRNGAEVLAVSSDGPDASRLAVPHRVVEMTRAITPFRDLLALIALVRVIRHFRPDIVHTHTPKAGLLGMMAAWICGIPVRIHTIGGLPWMESRGIRRWVLKRMEALTIGCASAVLVNSNNLRKILGQELPSVRKPMQVLGAGSTNGIDTAHFSRTPELENIATRLRSDHGIAEADFVFCFVGRLVLHKGLVELVHAFDALREIHPNIHLLLVGPFERDREQLPQEIEDRINRGDGIISPGMVDDVRPWLVAAQAFVLPTWREGFPNVLLQAGSLGVPVIATDINGCNEIIASPEMGLIYPPKDTDALRQAMAVMIQDRASAGLRALELKRHIILHYDQHRIWHELLGFYQREVSKIP